MGVATTYNAGRSIDTPGRRTDTASVLKLLAVSGSMFPRLFVLASIVLITCACAPQGNVRKPVAAPDPLVVANRQANAGDYAGAASAYYALAQSASGAQSVRLKSLAALAYQDASDWANAAAVLAELDAAAIESEPLATLAQACTLNQAGDYAGAFALLEAVDAQPLTPYQRGHYQRCWGLAALETNRGAQAAEALVSAYRYPYPDDQTEALNLADLARRHNPAGRPIGWPG